MTTPTDRTDRQARILHVLRLAEEEPSLAELRPYLDDPDAQVRTSAVTTLTETTPDGFEIALVRALADAEPEVRQAAAAGLAELEEILPSGDRLDSELTGLAVSDDAFVRETVLHLLRARGSGTREMFQYALADADAAVRIQAVRGLVSLNLTAAVAGAAQSEGSREVRVAVARGLATISDPSGAPALVALAGDPDRLVRAAALEASVAIGCPAPLDRQAAEALGDASWEIRRAAAIALEAATPEVAVTALVSAAQDAHIDVRKAAVRSLARWASFPLVAVTLTSALGDSDADVRAYARQALSTWAVQPPAGRG